MAPEETPVEETAKPTKSPRAKAVKEPTADQLAAAATLEDEAAKRPVIVKLARIMADLPTLTPEGENKHFNYKFIKDTQVSGAIRPRMARERLMVIPEVLEESQIEVPTRNGKSYLTKLKVRFTVIDGDSGDEVSGVGEGYGDDSGDKGANKALTAAMKYWLIKLFQIGGEDDLESDQRADTRASERETGGNALAAAVPVKVESANAGSVQRGGHQDRISRAQMNQLHALYVDLNLTPEGLAERFDRFVGIPLQIDPEGDTTLQLNNAIKALTGDEAGEFITKLINEKDGQNAALAAADLGGADGEPHPYG